MNERSTPINGSRWSLIHIQKHHDERVLCVAQAKIQERKGNRDQLTFQPTSTAASPSPWANPSSETPHTSPAKPGFPSPPNCSWTIEPQHVQTSYRADLKASVPRCLNLSSLKCSSPGCGQGNNTMQSFVSWRLFLCLWICLKMVRTRVRMMMR